jgi:hypothetical protein
MYSDEAARPALGRDVGVMAVTLAGHARLWVVN